jgi:hypothetical protein
MAWTNFAAGIFTAGQILTAAQMNTYVRDNITAGGPCFLRVRRAVAQSIAGNTAGAVRFDTEDVDTAGIFTVSANTITIATAGLYMLSATVGFETNGTGTRGVAIFSSATVSGATDAALITAGTRITGNMVGPASAVTQTVPSCSTLFNVTAGQVFAVMAYQNSGGALNCGNVAEQTTFSAAYVGAV